MRLPWLDVNIKSVQELLWYLHTSPKEAERYKRAGIEQNIATPEPQPATSQAKEAIEDVQDQLPPNQPPPEVTVVESSSSPLFALIIGINQYVDPSIPDLRGAVHDADQVQEFLVSRLKVQPDRIVNLRDTSATREAILAAIQNLATNPSIQPTDPILIYYAGHGAEAPCPSPSLTSSKPEATIQMLLPYDFVHEGSKGKEGQGIFDVTLSRLLLEVAKKKSDNITVILDSCHSGSGTRHRELPDAERDETLLVRGIKLPDGYTIPAEMLTAEQHRASAVSSGYEKAGLRSHVLLAACLPTQGAMERQARGAFTSALLTLLSADGVEQLTYEDVIRRLPALPKQDPQCEGLNRQRTLFNSKVVSSSRQVFIVKPSSGNYLIEAGEVHGIAPSSSFAVHSERELKSQSFLGTIIVTKVSAFQSLALCAEGTSLSPTPGTMYAVQTHAGKKCDLRLLIEPPEHFIGLFAKLVEQMELDATHRSFKFVNGLEEEPHLVLRVNPDTRGQPTETPTVQFEIMEPLCRQYGLTMMPYNNVKTDETGHLFRILSSAADFYWKLHHSNKAAGVRQATGTRAGGAKGGMMTSGFENSMSATTGGGGGGEGEGASLMSLTPVQNPGTTLTEKLEVECFKLVTAREALAHILVASGAQGAVEQLQKDMKMFLDNDMLVPLPGPDGGDPQNLCVKGSIVLDLKDPDVQYGFRITNNSGIPLYAALFYFDVSDLSISPYFIPPAAQNGKAQITLPPKGERSLKIGFGDSGTPPYEYFLRPNQLVDVGFLKLYFSNTYVNFSQIQQVSPFEERDLDEKDDADMDGEWEADEDVNMEEGEVPRQMKRKLKRGDGKAPRPNVTIWETLCIPVIQKRGV